MFGDRGIGPGLFPTKEPPRATAGGTARSFPVSLAIIAQTASPDSAEGPFVANNDKQVE